MKQTWESVADLKIGDKLELRGTNKKRKITAIEKLTAISNIKLSDGFEFAISNYEIVAVFS